jgi:hypothetical protein
MSAIVLQFPQRHRDKVLILEAAEEGWLVVTPNAHGWLHGSHGSARDDAKWLAANFGVEIVDRSALQGVPS